MDKKDKLLRYSIQVSYLGILLREGLLTDEEYEKCMSSLKSDYGIVSDILVVVLCQDLVQVKMRNFSPF